MTVQDEARQALAAAAAAADVPLAEVERVAQDFRARLAVEQSCPTVGEAFGKLDRVARLARELRTELYLDPSVALAAGLDQSWAWAVPRALQPITTLAELAEVGTRLLEEQATGCARGGRGRGLAAVLAPEPAKQRLAADLADLMTKPTTTVGGKLYLLVAAVVGDERGVAHAVRMALRKPPK